MCAYILFTWTWVCVKAIQGHKARLITMWALWKWGVSVAQVLACRQCVICLCASCMQLHMQLYAVFVVWHWHWQCQWLTPRQFISPVFLAGVQTISWGLFLPRLPNACFTSPPKSSYLRQTGHNKEPFRSCGQTLIIFPPALLRQAVGWQHFILGMLTCRSCSLKQLGRLIPRTKTDWLEHLFSTQA